MTKPNKEECRIAYDQYQKAITDYNAESNRGFSDREILYYKNYYVDDMTYNEIAKTYGISATRVSQICQHASHKMDVFVISINYLYDAFSGELDLESTKEVDSSVTVDGVIYEPRIINFIISAHDKLQCYSRVNGRGTSCSYIFLDQKVNPSQFNIIDTKEYSIDVVVTPGESIDLVLTKAYEIELEKQIILETLMTGAFPPVANDWIRNRITIRNSTKGDKTVIVPSLFSRKVKYTSSDMVMVEHDMGMLTITCGKQPFIIGKHIIQRHDDKETIVVNSFSVADGKPTQTITVYAYDENDRRKAAITYNV